MPFDTVRNMPLARVYAAHHVNLNRLGHTVNYPRVIAARSMMERRSLEAVVQSAEKAGITGILNLD